MLQAATNCCRSILSASRVLLAILALIVLVAGLTLSSTATYACPGKDGPSIASYQLKYTVEVKAATPVANVGYSDCCTKQNRSGNALCMQSYCATCSPIAPVHVVGVSFCSRFSFLCPRNTTALVPAISDVDFRPPRLV